MKKLYRATVSGEFVFLSDANLSHNQVTEEACVHLPRYFTAFVDDVSAIDSKHDLPDEWKYKKPLCAVGDNDLDCDDYFRGANKFNEIKKRLEDKGYAPSEEFLNVVREVLREKE